MAADLTGPHDVYVIRDATTGRIYHFGETGRGSEVRGSHRGHVYLFSKCSVFKSESRTGAVQPD